MVCVKCRELRHALELKCRGYIEARSTAYYRVSTKLAAHKNVDMERARNDLEEHQFVCMSARKSTLSLEQLIASAMPSERNAATQRYAARAFNELCNSSQLTLKRHENAISRNLTCESSSGNSFARHSNSGGHQCDIRRRD